MRFSALILFILLFVVIINQCSAIYCYVCNSIINEGCGDNFTISTSDSKLRAWCDASCITRRGIRVDGAISRVETIRGCIRRREEECYSDYFNDLVMTACTCNSNLCNGSPLEIEDESQFSLTSKLEFNALCVVATFFYNILF